MHLRTSLAPVRPSAAAVALVALAGLAGCGKKNEAPPAPAPAASAAPVAAAPSAPPPRPMGSANPFQIMNHALAAASAAAKGPTPCDRAYNGLAAMVAELEKTAPPGAAPKKVPERDKFIAVCADFPPAFQQCVDVTYGMSHAAECQAEQKKLDPAKFAKFKALLGG